MPANRTRLHLVPSFRLVGKLARGQLDALPPAGLRKKSVDGDAPKNSGQQSQIVTRCALRARQHPCGVGGLISEQIAETGFVLPRSQQKSCRWHAGPQRCESRALPSVTEKSEASLALFKDKNVAWTAPQERLR